jgi:4-amino-4-deoxy-L-arabinose transferase-like glycosyltransferase
MAVSAMNTQEKTLVRPRKSPSAAAVWLFLAALFAAVQFASLFTPPLLDDVDAAHAQAAQHMVESGDWITPEIDGVRYLEKPPLPYWLAAGFYYLFGENVYASHLPNALAMLGLAWLGWLWARRAWGERAGLYAGMFMLTAIGPFLFTRFIIPESILSFFLLLALWCLLTGLESSRPLRFYGMWAALALAILTKGLIAPIFFLGATIPFLLLTGQWRRWRELKPVSGGLLFLAIALPWHILCGLANPDQGHPVGNHPTLGNVHGFWYFYFVNEHLDRFLGTRYPHDYNKLPSALYWLLHLVWLYPWSLFLPAVAAVAWKTRREWLGHLRRDAGHTVDFYLDHAVREDVASYVVRLKFRVRTAWLLGLFAGFILLFFSLSTNQEYYTFEAWPPIFILIAGVLAGLEESSMQKSEESGKPLVSLAWLTGAHGAFAAIGVAAAAALGWGLWISRSVAHPGQIGDLLAHRDVAGYTLSMSHLFDLTGRSFAALRLPSALAAAALLVGSVAALVLRRRRRHMAATIGMGLTLAVFLVAAHIAFARFAPMLSSEPMAATIIAKGTPADTLIIYGDQSDASSVIFYTNKFFHARPALIVMPRCGQDGQGSTLLWGSCYPDAPDIFLSDAQLAKMWGTGSRKWLFAQDKNRVKVEHLLAGRLYPVETLYDKTLWTDRPLQ